MSDEPRHIALERQLAAEGWERKPEWDDALGHGWCGPQQIRKLVPCDPSWRHYDSGCDQVEMAMAQARGETWASTLRERDELRALVAELDGIVAAAERNGWLYTRNTSHPVGVRTAIARHKARKERDDG